MLEGRRSARRQAFETLEDRVMSDSQPQDRHLASTIKKYVQTDQTLHFRAYWNTVGCESYHNITFLVTKSSTKFNSGKKEASTSTSISLEALQACDETHETKATIVYRNIDDETPGLETLTIAKELKSATYTTNGLGFNSSYSIAKCPKPSSCASIACLPCEVLQEGYLWLAFSGTWKPKTGAKGKPTNTTASFIESSPTSYFSSSLTGQSRNATIVGMFKVDSTDLPLDPSVKLQGFLSKFKTTVISSDSK